METKKVVPVEPLTAAIARGWCHPMNSHKEMDTNLVFAIADEVTKWLVAALRAEVERLTKENKFLNAENLELEATQQACKSAERRLAVVVGALEESNITMRVIGGNFGEYTGARETLENRIAKNVTALKECGK